MDDITDQNQSVSHPVSLASGACIRAGQRAAAGKAARARAGLVTHRGFGPASSRGPRGPGAARRPRHGSPARPGAFLLRTSRGFRDPGRGRADGRPGGAGG